MTSTCSARPASMRAARQVEGGEEAHAGGVDVDRGGRRAERVGDERRGAGRDLVGGERRDEDEVEVGRGEAGVGQRGAARRRSARSLRRSPGAERAPAADAGALLDPARRRRRCAARPRRSARRVAAARMPSPAMPAVLGKGPGPFTNLGSGPGPFTKSGVADAQARAGSEVALDELVEHAAGADVDEGVGAQGVERAHRGGPAHRRGQRGGELAARVGERRGGRARDDRDARRGEPDGVERGGERRRPRAPSPASGTRPRRRAPSRGARGRGRRWRRRRARRPGRTGRPGRGRCSWRR